MNPTDTTGDNHRAPDWVGAEATLWRADLLARERSALVGHGIMVWFNDQVAEKILRPQTLTWSISGDQHEP